ncbi:hypothetical protein HK101_003475 [Irineochytrium annulatum]|nr:hypothetical protein HK101_003475 [Irineochytrium annulatum]
MLDVFSDGLLHLISTADLTDAPKHLPESFRMDSLRLQQFRHDWQDVTIMASLLILYRGCSGGAGGAADMTNMKGRLWVLLNDAETSMVHVVLEMCRCAGEARGRPVGDAERERLAHMVDGALGPEGRVYAVLSGRVGSVLGGKVRGVIEGRPAEKAVDVAKGLSGVEEEVGELGERVGRLAGFHWAVHFDLYRSMYEEVRAAKGLR